MMCNYDIDRFCGFCGIKIKNAVAEKVFRCPECGMQLRKKRINRRHKYIKATKKDKTLNKEIAKPKRSNSTKSQKRWTGNVVSGIPKPDLLLKVLRK